MNYEMLVAGFALLITIIANIIMIAYFTGQLKSNQDHQKEMLALLRSEFKENFDRLEAKQDKHNNLIERMARVEDKASSAHHRIDDISNIVGNNQRGL